MFRAAKTLLLGGLAGKVLGVARELVTAGLLGTGPVAAAYRLAQAAFLIPLNGIVSDALSAGFTPAYARSGMEYTDRGRVLFASVHAVVLVVSLAGAVLLALLAGQWVRVLAPGFDVATAQTTASLVAVLALAVPFYSLSSLYSAVGVAAGEAGLAAARASWQNVGVLGGTLLAWFTGEPLYIAVGFVAAYAGLAAYGARTVHARGLKLWPGHAEWSSAREALLAVWRAVRVLLLVPVLIQVHLIIERRVASIVDADAVAALDYARFLTDTSVLLLAMPLGVAGLGAMAQLNDARFRALAVRALRPLLYAGVPLSLAAALHAETIVRAVYARGAFDAESVATTAAILQWSAPGLWGLLVGYAGAKFLSARGGNVRVIGLYAAAYGVNAAVNLMLYPYFGVATLGLSAAANGIVFGLLVMGALGVLGHCGRDLATLAALASAYLALVALAPAGFSANAWLPLLAFAAYWCAAVTLVPSCRKVIHETWSSFRAA